jgi:hypothetical protein
MSDRDRVAVLIVDPGASNPSGVARALVEAIDGARAQCVQPHRDPACRLITYHLAHLMGISGLGRVSRSPAGEHVMSKYANRSRKLQCHLTRHPGDVTALISANAHADLIAQATAASAMRHQRRARINASKAKAQP